MAICKSYDGLAVRTWSKPIDSPVVSNPNGLEAKDIWAKHLLRNAKEQWMIKLEIYYQK